MNHVVEELMSYYTKDENDIEHYGMPRRSGRYPYGSGEDPYQHSIDFLGRVDELRKQGFTYTDENGQTWKGDTAIAKSMGMSTTQFRAELGLAKDERRMLDVARARSLKEDGLGATEIGRKMGLPESTVRSLLDENSAARMNKAKETAEFLKARLKEVEADGGMLDVGAGVELELNISSEKLKQSLEILKQEGYEVYSGRIQQVNNPNQGTTQTVLCPPGTEHKEIFEFDRVHTVNEYISRDGGDSFEKKFHYPESMDSKRLQIRYNEEGGLEMDGVVELRRGVDDLSLGNSRYSQVRILVDGTHYIKGMAIYADDLPDGVDVRFNTNKKKGTPMTDVLKKIKEDPDNPFGSAIKDVEQGGQYWYVDKNGKKKLGLINKRADEGDWDDWKDALPSQFLGKQSLSMVKKQLDLAKANKYEEYDDICACTNPTIKKHLLEKFSTDCDAAAVNLQAAALPNQKYHVIIPMNTLKDTEVYAPKYADGEKLALVRYPHGGTFEIPILTVNNKNAQGKKILGTDALDAVGITSKVAERLSGADFDGDTVMCIPTHDKKGKVRITSTDPLEGLKGFDPKEKYGPDSYKGKNVRLMTKKGTQTEMGVISNLITDMTLAGADTNELAAAVRHSMVVIDAEKHKLNYKQSEVDNNIAALHKKYQGKTTGGAATILSRSKGQESVEKRQGTPHVNLKGSKDYDPTRPEGALIYKVADDATLYKPKFTTNKATGVRTYTTTDGTKIKYDPSDGDAAAKYRPTKHVDKATGKVTYTDPSGKYTYTLEKRTQKSTKMAETDDAYTLVSDARHPKEIAYADYANSMKSLGNKARVEISKTGKIAYSKTAANTYKKEVKDLDDKLKNAEKNRVRERAAQRMSQAELQTKKKAGVFSDSSEERKAGQRALTKYRQEVGSDSRKERNIKITDREWEAIQAGAISENKLKRILNNTDVDDLRQRATPRSTTTLSQAKINKIKNMSNSNYSISQIAESLGVSPSTVSKYLKGVN